MAVVDAEERALGPQVAVEILGLGLHDIQNDGHPVFIVISYDSLVGVSAVARDQAVPLV